nr:hypothetical protein [Microvirga calopogonii]
MEGLLSGPLELLAADAGIEFALGDLERIRQGITSIRWDDDETKWLQAEVVRCPGGGPHQHEDLVVRWTRRRQMPRRSRASSTDALQQPQPFRLRVRKARHQ